MVPADASARSTAVPVTLAVVNARVWTGDARRPWADAVVVRGDRLGFVGSGAEARKLTRGAPDARVIDAAGQFLAPAASGDLTAADALARLHDTVTRRTPDADLRPLRAGEPADFVLVDRDLTRLAPGLAGDARLVLVVRGGRVVESR